MKHETWIATVGRRSRNRSRPWIVMGILGIAVCCTPGLAAKGTTAESGNACQQTAIAALAGCKASAQSDYKTALGKCVNLTDPKERQSCERQAAAGLKDALDTCQGGFE